MVTCPKKSVPHGLENWPSFESRYITVTFLRQLPEMHLLILANLFQWLKWRYEWSMELIVPSTKLGHSLSSCGQSSNQSVSNYGNIIFLSWEHIFHKTFLENVLIFFNSTFEPTFQQSILGTLSCKNIISFLHCPKTPRPLPPIS